MKQLLVAFMLGAIAGAAGSVRYLGSGEMFGDDPGFYYALEWRGRRIQLDVGDAP